VESVSQTAFEPMQELLTVHGATQGESSDAVSIYTASTSVSGNGKFANSIDNIKIHTHIYVYIYIFVSFF